ncbi:hypothetical protein LXL04_017846 [Taraxacum kok-saghyz]
MASRTTCIVYSQVIKDVISNIREEFIKNGGAGEGVLNDLQGLWELKLKETGTIFDPVDLNVPYEAPEEYETPSADLLFPPTPLQTTIETPFPVQTLLPTDDTYMKLPSLWSSQIPTLDANADYADVHEEVKKEATSVSQPTTQDFFPLSSGKPNKDDFPSQLHTAGYIPQQDGTGDSEIHNTQGVANEDHNVANTPSPAPAPTEIQIPAPAQNDVLDDDEEEESLNENDDEDEPDLDEGDGVQHLILATFDKVTRTKSKWKCHLNHGIMHVDDRDILFKTALGEFDF